MAAISLLIIMCILGYFYFFSRYSTSIGNLKPFFGRYFSHYTGTKSETPSSKLQFAKNSNFKNIITKFMDNQGKQKAQTLRKDKIKSHQHEIEQLQNELLDLKAQKASTDNKIGILISRYDELVTQLKELESNKKHGEAHVDVVKKRDKMLPQLEQKLKDLESALNQEKIVNNKLRTELLKETSMVADFHKKLETFQNTNLQLEAEVARSKDKIAQLQGQLSDLNNKQVPATLSPLVGKKYNKPTSKNSKSKLNPILQSINDILGP
jgi:chromosome segregation ATPase